MSIEDSRQGALVCKADVEVLWEPGNFQDDGAKRVRLDLESCHLTLRHLYVGASRATSSELLEA